MRYGSLIIFFLLICLAGCSPGKHYSPRKKYPKEALEADYRLLWEILKAKHPSLYWYTPKDSLDRHFDSCYALIRDSMTENRFGWEVLAPMVSRIRCGHTSIRVSKGYEAWSEGKKFPSFPLHFKIMHDSLVVTVNLNKKDSLLKKGMVVSSINGMKSREIIGRFMKYLPADGYALNMNLVRISGNFPYYHRNVFGLSESYEIEYSDSTGQIQKTKLPLYNPPVAKSPEKRSGKPVVKRKTKLSRKEKIRRIRSFEPDSSGRMAVMTINSFHKGHLRGFFRQSFKTLNRNHVPFLVIDLRSNGGGKISASTLLTRYVSRKPFRIADSAYAVTNSLSPYEGYIKGGIFSSLAMKILSSKRRDGKYHMARMEKKRYEPKKKWHYDGNIYILTNGPTFSASTLFCNAVKGQDGILLAGEETGGGWYGNNGILIPDITLPATRIRVRLPLFRVVQFDHVEKKGSGIVPDILIPPGYGALMTGKDSKMEQIKRLIFESPDN